jgi:hypothetical protein
VDSRPVEVFSLVCMQGTPPPPPPPQPKVVPLVGEVQQDIYKKKSPKEVGRVYMKPVHECGGAVQIKLCDILSQKWPKGDEHRMATFTKSSDDFPMTLVLFEDNNVIGHVLCSKTCEFEDAVIVESVIVDCELQVCILEERVALFLVLRAWDTDEG